MSKRRVRKQRKQRRYFLVAVGMGLLAFLWYVNKVTNREYEDMPLSGPAKQAQLMWSDLANLLPPIEKDTLAKLPKKTNVSTDYVTTLEKCYDHLAKGDPWTAQRHCEDAVLKSGTDPRAFIGRAYANLPKPTTKPSRDDFNTACRMGYPPACEWADRLPSR